MSLSTKESRSKYLYTREGSRQGSPSVDLRPPNSKNRGIKKITREGQQNRRFAGNRGNRGGNRSIKTVSNPSRNYVACVPRFPRKTAYSVEYRPNDRKMGGPSSRVNYRFIDSADWRLITTKWEKMWSAGPLLWIAKTCWTRKCCTLFPRHSKGSILPLWRTYWEGHVPKASSRINSSILSRPGESIILMCMIEKFIARNSVLGMQRRAWSEVILYGQPIWFWPRNCRMQATACLATAPPQRNWVRKFLAKPDLLAESWKTFLIF